ncbi:cytochrome B [Methylobacterium sp. Leaf469]|jgi:cytochrome b561|uniref:cytochrome b n=1 Tax=unclassified Methylobacterium TaxID=2615210 RepID=UPI000700ACE5|nr:MULTISPECIES: cytochrome b [unclassified Methylobacterium]USU30099.1 cytochrome b [Methylobacterium sp. OTU13CASTA1]KQO55902.1 cytochrome B [Methylobacterium sp. Leaf87]KQP26614.1 cytochrome B [Methylobacterium sp. Leaf100]KQP28183.1 cytochrome B [Methylobacterium sp. Leaf102]KQP58425.1 cytochrome B [Methylobacterium sp. Leaf112]
MSNTTHFNRPARLLHWTMAGMILAMLFIGVAMVTSLAHYDALVALHRPLGIGILILAVLRLVNRWRHPPPALPPDLPGWQRQAAHASHRLLYGLMLGLPLIGWAMLSAAGYPIGLGGSVVLPPILPRDPAIYAWLRPVHSVLAYALFGLILAHLGAALMHGLIRRDGVFSSMALRATAPRS